MTLFTNPMQEKVKEFHKAFGHPVSNKPTLPQLERFTHRKGWGSIEEAVEQLYVIAETPERFDSAIETLHNYLDKAKEKQLQKSDKPSTEQDKITALVDGLADELYFLLGDCVEVGVDIEPILNIVQQSNMSKLFTDEDGNKYAKNDENGKIMKSPEFFPPEDKIKEEVLNQINK